MASFLFFTIYPPGGHGLMVSFFCVPLKGGKDPLAGRGSHTRCETHPPAIRLVSYGISDEFHAKAWAPCLPLPFQGRTITRRTP